VETREVTSFIKEYAYNKYGSTLDDKSYRKAMDKMKRWAKAAYGGLDWDNKELDEWASTWEYYYDETIEDKTNGKDTLNRNSFNR
jgi:hypothetical protein